MQQKNMPIESLVQDLKNEGVSIDDVKYIMTDSENMLTIEELTRMLVFEDPFNIVFKRRPVVVAESWWATPCLVSVIDKAVTRWEVTKVSIPESMNWTPEELQADIDNKVSGAWQ